MYAIVRSGGKQYRVEEGRTVSVERLPAGEGETVELGDVLLIADDGEVTVGSPTIEGARVLAEVERQGRSPKVVVFKYKAKVRYRRKRGHRQPFTRLAVREILRPGQESKLTTAKPARRRRRQAAEEPEAAAEAAEGAGRRPARRPARRPPARARAAKAETATRAPAARGRPRPAKAAKEETSSVAGGEGATKPGPQRSVRRKTREGTE